MPTAILVTMIVQLFLSNIIQNAEYKITITFRLADLVIERGSIYTFIFELVIFMLLRSLLKEIQHRDYFQQVVI